MNVSWNSELTGKTISLLAIFCSNFFLFLIYRYYEYKWPEQYFGPENKANIFLSIKPYYYFVFRIMPILVTILLINGTLFKLSGNTLDSVLIGGVSALVFALRNDGKAIYDLVTHSQKIKVYRNKYFQLAAHFITILLLFCAGLTAGFLATNNFILDWFIPDLKALRDNVYASFIAVVLSFALYKIIKKPNEISLDSVIEKSIKNIDRNIYSLIEIESKKYNANQILVKAICISENIERPRWIRKIENVMSMFKKNGTYGIMQVSSNKRISDQESIKIAVPKFFANTDSPNIDIEHVIRAYNPQDDYVSLVVEVYKFITIEKYA